jgi:phosphonate dehydrogenase
MASVRPRILVAQPVHDDVRARLAVVADVDMHPGPDPLPPAVLAERLREADALMGFMTERVDAPLLAAAPRLRIVAAALKGYDNYDAAACAAGGVWLSIVPDLLTAPTAELAVGLAIGLARHVREGDMLVRMGSFEGWRARLYGRGLDGSTVAVVGLGALGAAIVQRLQGFGCRIVGVDRCAEVPPGVQPLPLDAALREADFAILALPLTASTRHLIDAGRIAAARPGMLWVNVGRGSVVDEAAMAEHLAQDPYAGYAADVFAFEDWAEAGRPRQIPAALRARTNTLFTPHLGSAVGEVRRAIEHRAADNILAVLAGAAPPDAVNGPQSASKAAIGTVTRTSPSSSPTSAR